MKRQLALLAVVVVAVALGCARVQKRELAAPAVAPPRGTAPSAVVAPEMPAPAESPHSMPSRPAVAPPVAARVVEISPVPQQVYRESAETYAPVEESTFNRVQVAPLSTFSIDVDTASYANVRRFLSEGILPPLDAVRVEELLNYFTYDYPEPEGEAPFGVSTEIGACPWAPKHRLARIGVKGRDIPNDSRPPANLVFLIDVSGSMDADNKLPLIQRSLGLLVPRLRPDDRLAVVTYSDTASVALDTRRATGNTRDTALGIIGNLRAGGSTQGSDGLRVAYQLANEGRRGKEVSRVILCTDGDFNVGVTENDALVELLREEAKNKVFLTVLGFGTGNLKDSRLEKLADDGNGKYNYVDSLTEARKVFLEEMTGTLVTIAKDVKIQVEFNPARVAAYRLIGYENRTLTAQEFNDDTRDAGEIGAGHTVTALYEIVPLGQEVPGGAVDELRYQTAGAKGGEFDGELFLVKLRYKPPREEESLLLTFPVRDLGDDAPHPSQDYQFAAAVAGFGLLLRESPYVKDLSYDTVIGTANDNRGADEYGHRAEFVNLVRNAAALAGNQAR